MRKEIAKSAGERFNGPARHDGHQPQMTLQQALMKEFVDVKFGNHFLYSNATNISFGLYVVLHRFRNHGSVGKRGLISLKRWNRIYVMKGDLLLMSRPIYWHQVDTFLSSYHSWDFPSHQVWCFPESSEKRPLNLAMQLLKLTLHQSS